MTVCPFLTALLFLAALPGLLLLLAGAEMAARYIASAIRDRANRRELRRRRREANLHRGNR